MKATHKGECQVCGATQKLPNGQLAKHGYTTKWGFFSGTCWGSEELPWEQDNSLVAGAVERARSRLSALQTEIEALQQPATTPKAWANVYFSGSWSAKSTRRWMEVEVFRGEFGRWSYRVEGEEEPQQAGYYGDTALAVATQMNRNRAAVLGKEAAQVAEYIRWQEKRLASWTPKELKPTK